jgi:nucleoid-associated protein YejK
MHHRWRHPLPLPSSGPPGELPASMPVLSSRLDHRCRRPLPVPAVALTTCLQFSTLHPPRSSVSYYTFIVATVVGVKISDLFYNYSSAWKGYCIALCW